MSASECFEFWIYRRGPKNKKYVFFYSGPFSYLGGETKPQSYNILKCSSTIALNFGYGLEDRKIKNTCLFITARFHVYRVQLLLKVHKNNWCPPPIALVFGYVLEDRKIRNTCFL